MTDVYVVTADAHNAPAAVFYTEADAYAFVAEQEAKHGLTIDWRATGYEVIGAPEPDPPPPPPDGE